MWMHMCRSARCMHLKSWHLPQNIWVNFPTYPHTIYHLYVYVSKLWYHYQARFCLLISYPAILFTMLMGFLNRGSLSFTCILLPWTNKAFTFSIFLRGAMRSRPSAGHTMVYITELSQIEHWRILGRRAINCDCPRHSSAVLLICDFAHLRTYGVAWDRGQCTHESPRRALIGCLTLLF